MKKRFLAIAIASGLASPFAVHADATTFGKINISVGMIEACNEDPVDGIPGSCTPGGAGSGEVDNWQVRSHASRLGFKGEEDLGNGLAAKFHLEYGVNPDGNGADDDGLTRRNQWVGLKGGFGEIRVGRHDTPLKMAQGKFDQFNDMDGDIDGALDISLGENRVDNAIAYLGKAADVKFGIALVPGESDGINGGDGPADTISAAIMYDAGPAFLSLAMDQYDDTASAPGDTEDLLRLTGIYKMGTMQFGLMFEQEGTNGGVGEQDMMAFNFAMGMGDNKVKFQYVNGDDDVLEKTMMSLGYDIGLSKRSTAYVAYNDGEVEGAGGATLGESTTMVVGMIHKF